MNTEKLFNTIVRCSELGVNAGFINKNEANEIRNFIQNLRHILNNRTTDGYYKEFVDSMNGKTFDYFPFKEAYTAGYNKIIELIEQQ